MMSIKDEPIEGSTNTNSSSGSYYEQYQHHQAAYYAAGTTPYNNLMDNSNPSAYHLSASRTARDCLYNNNKQMNSPSTPSPNYYNGYHYHPSATAGHYPHQPPPPLMAAAGGSSSGHHQRYQQQPMYNQHQRTPPSSPQVITEMLKAVHQHPHSSSFVHPSSNNTHVYQQSTLDQQNSSMSTQPPTAQSTPKLKRG